MTIQIKEQTTKKILKDISKELDLEHSRKEEIKDRVIADLFADGKMKVKHTWIKAYDSESGKEGWISMDSVLHDIMKELEKIK